MRASNLRRMQASGLALILISASSAGCGRLTDLLDRKSPASPAEAAAIANAEKREAGAAPQVCDVWLAFDFDPANEAIPIDVRRFLFVNNASQADYCAAGLR